MVALNSTSQRLKFFIESKHLKARELAVEIGTSQPAVSEILNGKRTLSRGMIARIKAHYPQLNIQWLLTGEGDMAICSADKKTNNQFVGRDGNNYNESIVINEDGEKEDVFIELTEMSDPKDLMREIHRLKAIIFDRDEEIKRLKDKKR